MKIDRAVTRVLNTIDDTPLLSGLPEPGEHVGPRELVFVEIGTDEGVTGLGFTYWHGALAPALRAAVESLAACVIGENPLRTEVIAARLEAATGRTSAIGNGIFHLAKAAIDIACWDIKGKVAGVPIATLIGGRSDRTDAYASGMLLRGYSVSVLADAASRLVEMGFRQMKMQCGSEPYDDEVEERVRVIRETVGSDIAVMCDVNQLWSVHRARRLGHRLEPYGLAWIEDPVAADDLDGYALLRRTLRTPIVAGEYLYGIAQFAHMIATGAADIVMIDLLRVGGITPWVKVAGMAEAHNMKVVSHRLPELDVQLVSGAGNGHTIEYRPLTSGIFDETPNLDHGQVVVPDRPGHGLMLAAEGIVRYGVYEAITKS